MFRHIAWFEIHFWFRSWMLWIFLFGIGLLTFLASSADQIFMGTSVSNTYRNAPFVIESRYAFMCLFGLLMSTAFVNFAALRDFKHNTHQIIFSTPIRRRDFLLGRFFGAALISVVPMLGVSLGILLAKYTPWAEPERWELVNWTAHLDGILVFALPNIFFMVSILFAVAVLARKDAISFSAAFILFLGFVLADVHFQGTGSERAAALLDPFAIRTFALVTKYWTVAEKNTLSAGLGGLLLLNRLIWVGVGCAVFVASYFRFSFAERRAKHKESEPEEQLALAPAQATAPYLQTRNPAWSAAAQFLGSLRIHFMGMVKSNFFIVIAVAILVDVPILLTEATGGYGTQSFPVTYRVIDLIRQDVYFFVLVVVTYFAGALVWKDREERMDEIVDATPTREWGSYAGRLVTLVGMVMLIQAVALLAGIVVQAANGYYRFQFGLYVHELLVRDASTFVFLAILALLIHVLAPNKYAGYFVFIAFYCVNTFLWRPLNLATNLLQFAGRPDVIYSDFFGDAPYRLAWDWFTLYWLLFCALLAIVTVMFWPRGKQDRWKARSRNAALRFRTGWKAATAVCLLAFGACGGWIWYNTEVLNPLLGPKDAELVQAEYEKTYKPLDKLPQPRVRSVKYAIDVFPSNRNVNIRGDEIIYNPYFHPLDEIHFSLDPRYDTSIDIPGAALAKDDVRMSYRMYRFTSPLQPGEERTLRFTVKSKNRGFENNVSNPQVIQNGTFLNNIGPLVTGANYLAPVIGYNYWRELTDSVERKKYGLQEVDLMPPLERNCTDNCRDTYIPGHSDWVDISAIISTTPDQVAVAPGSLVREWQQDGRRYFEYKLDHRSMNLYCFASARYEVAREEWNGIKLEVYYLREHPWNVPRMMNSMKKSLNYYIKNFGAYHHKEARIVEFPRVAGFAAAFPGTMPYSESLGFIANLDHPDDIDTVFYVVAHEMGHQWWDEQVVGANMEGATLLSETLAQYSALMVMENEYGRDIMRKFLKYEMDGYLRSRGQERLKEHSLLTVEYNQFYIFYNKGGVALYYLKEMIGEDAVNRALLKLIHQYAYSPPPYPTSYALVDALREETPPNLQYLIKELFEDIILFSNRTLEATAVQRADGKYDVTIKVEARKFRADAQGNETEVLVDDWIDIGAFAKPASARKYGDTLYRQRMQITQRNSTFTFTTDQLPEKAGIDPFALLIDRIPDDNTKDVTLKSVPGQQAQVQ
jgi:ABC-type transport system involved in multi-copper enzyme maturation permease subunit